MSELRAGFPVRMRCTLHGRTKIFPSPILPEWAGLFIAKESSKPTTAELNLSVRGGRYLGAVLPADALGDSAKGEAD